MKKFIHDQFDEDEANVVAFGVPLGRKVRTMLTRMRELNWFVEFFDLDRKKNLLEKIKVFDSGDIQIVNYGDLQGVKQRANNILAGKKIPLMLSGGHLSTLYSMQAFPRNTKLVIFDAHCDAKDRYMDEKMVDLDYISLETNLDERMNDVTWLRRLIDDGHFDGKNVMLFGLRSGDLDELKFFDENGVRYFTARQVKKNLQNAAEEMRKFTMDSDVYVNVDIDNYDPSVAPAVDHPEPDGLFFEHVQSLIDAIEGKIVGLDTVALSPLDDESNQVTEFLAVRTIFEILGKINEQV